MKTKRSREGYAMTDHRWSPGISAETHRALHLDGPPVPGGQMMECALGTCCGCSADLFIVGRDNSGNWCRQCDSYMCDNCALAKKLTGLHRPYRQFIAETYEALVRKVQRSAQKL